jgi:hypothetical protein
MRAPANRQSGFWRDDSAQAIVVGALSMFFILPTVALVYNLSQLVNRRVAIQQAADAAAYSGALVEANSLSSIALTNEAMAYAYYGMMRQTVDVIVSGVLAEFERRGAPPRVVGIPYAGLRHDMACRLARTWVPQGKRWMQRLSAMSRAMARITPVLVKEEVARSAQRNGATVAAVYPTPRFYPETGYRLVYSIERLEAGWRVTNNAGYLLEIAETQPRKWVVTQSGGSTLIIEQLDKEHWKVSRGHYEADLYTDGRTYLRIDITDLPSGQATTHAEAKRVFGNSWEFDLKGTDFGMHVLPYQDGTYQVQVSSPSVNYSERVKWDQDNRLMVLRNGEWQYLPDQEKQIDVGGVLIDVTYVRRLTFPGGDFWPPSFVRFGQMAFSAPSSLSLPGVGIQIQPGVLTVYGWHGPVYYRISTQAFFSINGLTLQDADGRWRYWDERTRHRIIRDSEIHWTYEMQREPSDLVEESPLRLAYHAIMDSDPQARTPRGPALPDWTRWFRIEAGESHSPEAYYQTRPCWNPACAHRPGDRSSLSCRLCGGRDNDGDGRTDVRIYQYEVENYYRARGVPQINLFDIPAPLTVSEAFWKFGFSVGVWAPGPEPLLGQPRRTGSPFPFFRRAPAGLYAVASARVGFLSRNKTPAGLIEEKMLYNFDSPEDAIRWSQTGYQCLYEPVWSAKLVPVAECIRSADIGTIAPDSGTAHLFRAFKYLAWREVGPPEDFARDYTVSRSDVRSAFSVFRNRAGRCLNMEHPDFPGMLEH